MMPFDKYQENRLTVVGIEAPDNQRKSTAGTRVRLSNGQYLGDVKDIQITGGLDNAWKVQVVTSSVLTNEQVSNLFVKGGYIKPTLVDLNGNELDIDTITPKQADSLGPVEKHILVAHGWYQDSRGGMWPPSSVHPPVTMESKSINGQKFELPEEESNDKATDS